MKLILLTLLIFFLMLTPVVGFGQGVLDNFDFIGNEEFSSSQLIQWGGLSEGSFINPLIIASANKKIVARCQEEGYLFARIDSTVISENDKNNQVSVRWYLIEGPMVRLGNVQLIADSIDVEYLESIVDFTTGDIYRKEDVESQLQEIGHYYATNGFPLAVINISKTRFRTEGDDKYMDFIMEIESGPKISIKNIRIKGNIVTRDEVILREINIRNGDVFNQEKIDEIPDRLNRLGYFSQVPPVRIIGLKERKTELLIEVTEGNTTTFDGIVGYVPPTQNQKSEEGFFTGLINLNFRNLFGTGRKFEVNWQKSDRFSEQFRIFYEEPWILNLPLNLGLGLERIVRDTTYIERSYFIHSVLKLSADFKGFLRFSHKEVVPDSLASRTLRMTRNSVMDGEAGVTYDTRDYPINPGSGLFYMASFTFGIKKNTAPQYLIREDSLATQEGLKKLQISLSYYQRLWKNQVLAFNLHGAHIQSDKDQLQLSDHYWLGGFGTLRGYRENQFHGTTISWVNIEYRFIIGRNSRVFLFNDWGFYQYKERAGITKDTLPGYGVGIRFETPLGIMGVDYGFGRGDTFSTGKIHFGIINSF